MVGDKDGEQRGDTEEEGEERQLGPRFETMETLIRDLQ